MHRTDTLSFEFVCELRCVLISLLFARLHVEQTINTSHNDTTHNTTLLSTYRAQCQSIVEGSVCAGRNLAGDLGVWGEYIRTEGAIGAGEEARKV
jgi:hypothetical protein